VSDKGMESSDVPHKSHSDVLVPRRQFFRNKHDHQADVFRLTSISTPLETSSSSSPMKKADGWPISAQFYKNAPIS